MSSRCVCVCVGVGVRACVGAYVRACVRVCGRARACARACVRACARARSVCIRYRYLLHGSYLHRLLLFQYNGINDWDILDLAGRVTGVRLFAV